MYRVLVFIIVITFIGCGDDNSTGVEGDEAPDIPNIENAHPDISFFENNSPTTDDSAFGRARMQATSANFLLSLGQVYGSFLQLANEQDATHDNNTWQWNYTNTYQGMNIDIEVTAEESDNAMLWNMFWTADDGEGTSIEDFRIMEGNIQNDGSKGEWVFNGLNDSNEEWTAYISNWRTISDSEETITLELFEEGGSTALTLTYEKDEPEYYMTFNNPDEQEDVTVYWNTDSGTGYYEQGDSRQCWGENFEDVTCD